MFRKILIASGIMLSVGIGEALAAATTLKVVCFLPPRSVSVAKMFVPWIKSVEAAADELSGGVGDYYMSSIREEPDHVALLQAAQ